MEENKTSRTAISTAFYRAYHALHDDPKIFDDFLAAAFLTETEKTSLEREMVAGFRAAAPELAASFADEAAILAFMMQNMAAPAVTYSRARYAEDQLEKEISCGLQQYVNLGAGMDTFAFRRPDLLETLQVIELDHHATQAYKHQRIIELGWRHPAKLELMPVDFTQENIATALQRSAYNFDKPSFFSWLGVTYYLPHDTVLVTLRDIAAIALPGSTIVFDYLEADAFIAEKSAQRVQVMLMLAKDLNETMQMGFNPSTIAEELAALGLQLYEDLRPSDIQIQYFQGRPDGYYACEHAHLACVAVK